MRKKYIYIVLLSLLSLAGCVKELTPTVIYQGDGTTVDVSIPLNANGMEFRYNTKALDEQGEKNIQDIYVAFFPVSGSVDSPEIGNKIFGGYYDFDSIKRADPESEHSNAGCVSVNNIPTGSYYIVGIANVEYGAHNCLRDALDAAQTWDEINRIAVTLRDDPAFPINVDRNTPALCMSGFYRNPNTQDKDADPAISKPIPVRIERSGQLPGYIHLRRLDAQINFIVRNEIPNCTSFNMINARMFNVPKSSNLFEMEDDFSVEYVNTEEKTNAWVYKPRIPDSTDSDRTYDSYVWSLYMMENRGNALSPAGYDELSTYKQRELEYKNPNGTNRHDDSGDRVYDYVYAPDNSAFLEFTASMEQTLSEDGETFPRVANMKYVVHLGYCEGSTESEKVKDFNNFRNTKYTYIIHVRGVNDIVVEAMSDHLYDDSFSHGVEGSVIDLKAGQAQILDTHYGVFNMTMTRTQISSMLMHIKSKGGEWTSVPFPGGMISDSDMPAYIRNPESFSPFPNYLSEDYQSIRIAPLPEGWDPQKRLVSYTDTYDFDWPAGQDSWTVPTTLLPMHGERKVQQDDTHQYPIFDLISFRKAFSSPKSASNPWGYEVDGDDKPIDMNKPLYFTVFVNEYFYSYSGGMIPKERALNSDGSTDDNALVTETAWQETANTGHRFFRIISDSYDSADMDSHYLRGSIHIEQHALQTYYSDKVDLAVALEHQNEHHWKLMTQTHSEQGTGHGWLAAAKVMTGNDSRNWNTLADQTTVIGENYPAFTTLSYTNSTGTTSQYNYRPLGIDSERSASDKWTGRSYFPTSGADIDRKYYDVIEAALSRNRDLNRDGKITEDEIRWYLPFTEEYVNFAVGQGSLETPLFSRKDYSLDIVGNEQVYSNRRYHYIGADRNYLWSEEGTSTGGGVWGWEIRCCRLLGVQNDDYRSHTHLSLPYDYNAETNVFDTHKFADKGIHRGYNKGALQPHDNLALEANALPYYFRMAKQDSPLKDQLVAKDGNTRQQILWNRMVTNEYCRNYTEDPDAVINEDGTVVSANDKGAWHTPNQMELALMFYGPKIRPTNSQYVSSTYWWRNDGTTTPEGYVANATTDYRHFMGANGSNLRMLHTGRDLYNAVLSVRCVLDCDAEGRPIGSNEFGNPVEFHADDNLVSCTYDGDYADITIRATISAGEFQEVTVAGEEASVSGGKTCVSTVRIPVNSTSVAAAWRIQHEGKTLTYRKSYNLPARYWMISRYGVANRYAAVNPDNNRTYVGAADTRDVNSMEAIYKWILTKSNGTPVNESELNTSDTYYLYNAGVEAYISDVATSRSYMGAGGNAVPVRLLTRAGYDGYYVLRLNNNTHANSNGGVDCFGTWNGGPDDGCTYKLTPAVLRGELPFRFTPGEFSTEYDTEDGTRATFTFDASFESATSELVSVSINGVAVQDPAVTGDDIHCEVGNSLIPENGLAEVRWTFTKHGETIVKSQTYELPVKFYLIKSILSSDSWGYPYVYVDTDGNTRANPYAVDVDKSRIPMKYRWVLSGDTASPTGNIPASELVVNANRSLYLYNLEAQGYIAKPDPVNNNADYLPTGPVPHRFCFDASKNGGFRPYFKWDGTNTYGSCANASRNHVKEKFGFSPAGVDGAYWIFVPVYLDHGAAHE